MNHATTGMLLVDDDPADARLVQATANALILCSLADRPETQFCVISGSDSRPNIRSLCSAVRARRTKRSFPGSGEDVLRQV